MAESLIIIVLLLALIVLLLLWQNRWAKIYIAKNADKYFSGNQNIEPYSTVRYGVYYVIAAAMMCVVSAIGILPWDWSIAASIAAVIILVWMGIVNAKAIFSDAGVLFLNCASLEEAGKKVKLRRLDVQWTELTKVSVLNARHTLVTLVDGRVIDVKTKWMIGPSIQGFLVSPGSEIGPAIEYYGRKYGKLK